MIGFEQKTDTLFINADPVWGGIIDIAPAVGTWFVVFNHAYLMTVSDLPSKEAAYAVWERDVNNAKAWIAEHKSFFEF